LLEWFIELSPILRYGAAFLFLAISTALFFAGILWPWGWAVGVGLLILNIILGGLRDF
jgi:hypothetical protein